MFGRLPLGPEDRRDGEGGKSSFVSVCDNLVVAFTSMGYLCPNSVLSPVLRKMYYLGPCPEDVEPPSGRCIYLGPASQWKMYLPAPAPSGLGQIPVPLMLLSIFRTSALDVSMRSDGLRRFGQLFALAGGRVVRVGVRLVASGPMRACAVSPS